MTVPTGDISQTAPDWFRALMSDSDHTAAGRGAETWCPIEPGVTEMVRVGHHVPPQPFEHLVERTARPRERVIEPPRQLVGTERRRHAAITAAGFREVLGCERGERLGDRQAGIVLEIGVDRMAGRVHSKGP